MALADFDECKESTDDCSVSENEECVNINGSFNCICTDGYSKNATGGLCSGKLYTGWGIYNNMWLDNYTESFWIILDFS